MAIENILLAPTDDLESAILAVLDPGPYTAIMHGTNNGTGVGLVEVYNLGTGAVDLSCEAHLANISTRGNVQKGANVMIGGFINEGGTPIKVLVRAIGPSLTVNGTPNGPPLVGGLAWTRSSSCTKPDGTIVTNDNWMSDPTQTAAIIATTIPPTNALESAILVTLPVGEGAYTAIVSGANGTSGVGLVEAYFGNPCLGASDARDPTGCRRLTLARTTARVCRLRGKGSRDDRPLENGLAPLMTSGACFPGLCAGAGLVHARSAVDKALGRQFRSHLDFRKRNTVCAVLPFWRTKTFCSARPKASEPRTGFVWLQLLRERG